MKNARYDWKRGVLPMELITRSRERRRIAIIVVALVLALLIALAYTIVSSRQATAAAVETMSEVYLQELSNQVISHFNTGIDGKFCQLETVGSSLELYDPENLDEVRDFLACMEADDDEYAYLALRGSDGLYYTSWGSDAASDEELAARSELGLSYRDAHGHDVMLYNGTIALVDSFEPVTCGGVTFPPSSPGSASTPFPGSSTSIWSMAARGRASSASTALASQDAMPRGCATARTCSTRWNRALASTRGTAWTRCEKPWRTGRRSCFPSGAGAITSTCTFGR